MVRRAKYSGREDEKVRKSFDQIMAFGEDKWRTNWQKLRRNMDEPQIVISKKGPKADVVRIGELTKEGKRRVEELVKAPQAGSRRPFEDKLQKFDKVAKAVIEFYTAKARMYDPKIKPRISQVWMQEAEYEEKEYLWNKKWGRLPLCRKRNRQALGERRCRT